MNYSNRLKAYRNLKGINQKELAEYLGIALNTYNFKENGKIEFSLNEAKKLSEYFQCTIDEIFFGIEVRVMST